VRQDGGCTGEPIRQVGRGRKYKQEEEEEEEEEEVQIGRRPNQTHATIQRREGTFLVFSPNRGSRNSGALLHASHSSDGSGRALVPAAWRQYCPFGSGAPLYGSEHRGVLEFNRRWQGNKSMLGAKRIDQFLLPLVQHLKGQHGEVAEYPQQVNPLRKLGLDVARSYRCQHPQNTVRQLFDPHGWST
jgi:hypothetical protein